MSQEFVIADASIARPTRSRSSTPISSSGALQKMPVPKLVVEPASDEEADQGRRDDDPAEHADLADEAHHRRLAFLLPVVAPLALLADCRGQAIRRLLAHGFGSAFMTRPPVAPGRSGRR